MMDPADVTHRVATTPSTLPIILNNISSHFSVYPSFSTFSQMADFGPNSQKRYYPKPTTSASTTNLLQPASRNASSRSIQPSIARTQGALHGMPSNSSLVGNYLPLFLSSLINHLLPQNESPYSVTARPGSRVPSLASSISDKVRIVV